MLAYILDWLNTNSAAITAVSVFSAGLVWILRIPSNIYREEVLSIARWEKLIALNEVAVRDNIGFMKEWLNAISASRPYSCHFETLLLGDITTVTISDLGLTNKLLQINYMMKRSSDDLNNLYESYWKVIPSINEIPDLAIREENLSRYHATISSALEGINKSHITIHKEMVPILAALQVAGKIRFHSIFGYSKYFLNIYVWPRPSEDRVNLRTFQLQQEMQSKGFVVTDNK